MQDLYHKLMEQSYLAGKNFTDPETGERIILEKPGLVEHVLTMYLATLQRYEA